MPIECPQCGNSNREGARFCDRCGSALASGPARPDPVAAPPAREELPADLAPAPAGAPETVGSGRFEIVGFLGRSSRKQVYLARDRESGGELVAVSVFSTEGMAATAQARARREVEAMARLGDDSRVVPVLASGQDGPRPFIASRYMPGGDLEDLLEEAPGGRLGVERALALAIDVAAGLEHAHGCGIVHRDIKPANIWLEADGTARLGDFGLATDAVASREAVERMVVGTAAYLPPEQAIGRRTDERADLYSLGALLYELLTGAPPFPGDDPVSIITRHLSSEAVPPASHNPDVPARLDALVRRLLAKSPDERPASAAELRSELEAIAADPSREASTASENPLDALAGGVFVGREAELEELREALEGSISGRGSVALVEGEPGIGKTRLVGQLVTYARVRGALALNAACHEADAIPAYWPFAQAIRAYVRDADPVGLAWQLGADGPEIARIVPELRERVPSIGAPAPIEDEAARFRFFDAVAGFLLGVAASRPLLLLIDDLHWADPSSIELLRFLAHRLGDAPLLLVCAYRQEEAHARADLRRGLAELDEVPRRRRVTLHGLEAEAIGRYFQLTTGVAPTTDLVEEVHEQTGGNPFFVSEVVKLIASEDDLSRPGRGGREIPHGVSEAVTRRLSRLAPPTREALEVAAVIGREVEPRLLEAVLGREIDEAVEAARAARILERRGPESLLFAHAVFREVLHDGIGPARRIDLHRRAGEAIEGLHAEEIDAHLPALARHFLATAGAGGAEKARDYLLAAGRQEARRLAHADAAEHLAKALELLPRGRREEGLALRLELGEEMTRCGRFHDARRVLEESAAMARADGEIELQAEAAVKIAALSETGVKDAELTGLLEQTLADLGERDPVARSKLLAVLSAELYWEDAQGRCQEVANEALRLARESGDDGALATALAVRQFTHVARPAQIPTRLENAAALLEAARRAGDRTLEVRAHAYRFICLMQLGEFEAADRALADYTTLAERLGEPRHLWHVPIMRSTRAMLDGRFDESRALTAEAARLGALAEEPLAEQFVAVQLAQLHTYEGTPEEMLPTIRRMVGRYPAIPAWRLSLVGFLVDADREDEARQELEPVIARGLDRVPMDANWLVGLVRIGEAAARLGYLDICAELGARLAEFAGEIVVVGRAAAAIGPVDRCLGLMAAALGAREEAVAHLESTLAIAERMGDRPVRADARHHLGRVLLDGADPDERLRALELLSLALEEGQELGMRKLVERTVRLQLESQGMAEVDANASIEGVALAVADERPDLVSFASADGRVTILFSDIENSTLMNEQLGDSRWLEVLREHNAVFRGRLAEFGGYEVKNQGDGFMLAFPDPVAALRCALAVQEDLEGRRASAGGSVRVRIGMHVGEVIEEEGDFFGRSVVLAARVAAQARGGEVLVSEALAEAAAGACGFDGGRELELKGLAGVHRVYRARATEAAHAAT